MFEHHSAPLLPRQVFLRRMARHGGFALVLLTVSWAGGAAGFHALAGQPWIDAQLNAAMLLGGMGPIGEIQTDGGKVFASFYALYAGLVFIAVGAVLLAPIAHRLLHKFHVAEDRPKSRKS
jgi:hypothetical protein